MGSNGVCFADKSTDELLVEFQNGGASHRNGSAAAHNGNGNGNGHGSGAGGQHAFEEIVRRYAGMVYTVCLQVTRDVHDAEDATQAAFLTLALRAKTANNIKYLGPWLQKVARRLSLDIMRAKKRRKAREEKRGALVHELQPDRDPRRGLDRAEMADIVRDELGKLPAKYRLPLILHYFGGLRPEEVARELGYKPSTLGVRLHRGRKMLADSLADRGITLTSGMLATILAGIVHIGISDNVIASTSLAAAGISANGDLVGSIISARVMGLTRHATNALIWAKTKAVFAALLVAGTALAGTAQAIKTIAPQVFDLRMLDVTRFVRPLLRSLLRPPQFSNNANVNAPAPAQLAAADDALNRGPAPLALDWLPSAPPADVETISGAWGVTRTAAPLSLAGVSLLELEDFAAAREPAESSGSASVSLAQAGHALPPAAAPAFPAFNSFAVSSGPIAAPAPVAGFSFDPATRTAQHMAGARHFDRLVLDARVGEIENYVVGAQAQVFANNLTVAHAGRGSMRQLGGSVNVRDDLILGNLPGSDGRYDLVGGSLAARNQILGLSGNAQFTQSGGANQTQNLSIAFNQSSRATYAQSGGDLRTAQRVDVGVHGDGHLDQSGGTHVVGDGTRSGAVSVGVEQEGRGRLTLRGGTLRVPELLVGKAGKGTLTVDGGTLAVTNLYTGRDLTGVGTTIVRSGNVELNPSARVVVGGAGVGSMIIGSGRDDAPAVYEQPANSGADIVVREKPTAAGMFRGWGEVIVTGSIVNNGRMIADGFGKARSLDFSSATSVTNTIENPEFSGRNGWFTRHGGKLVLPPINVPDARTSTWGEEPSDPIPDLVNSVRFTVRDVEKPGQAILSLIAPDHEHLPALPEGESFVGVWGFERLNLEFGSGHLLMRYDDLMVNSLGGDESSLRLWIYEDGWERVPDEWTLHDPAFHLISAHVGGNFSLFGLSVEGAMPTTPMATLIPMDETFSGVGEGLGVAFAPSPVPEPAAAGLLAAAAASTLLRRRRRRQ